MRIENSKPTGRSLCLENLCKKTNVFCYVRAVCLLLFLSSTVTSTAVQAQTYTFAPYLFNTADPSNTNYHIAANWAFGFRPPNTITSNMTLSINAPCYFLDVNAAEQELVLEPGAVVNMSGNASLIVDAKFYNQGSISGGNLILNKSFVGISSPAPVRNVGTINTNDIQIRRLIHTGTIICNNFTMNQGGEFTATSSSKTTCNSSFVGTAFMSSTAEFTNNGNFQGRISLRTSSKLFNNGTFEGRIYNTSPECTIENKGRITLNGITSRIESLHNHIQGILTNDATLDTGGNVNNEGLIINNNVLRFRYAIAALGWKNNGNIENNHEILLYDENGFMNSGLIRGKGSIDCDIQWTNHGTISPGNSPGKWTHNGQYFERGKLLIEIGGTTAESEYDVLEIGNNRSHTILTSTLEVRLINGFSPSAGDSFTILTAQARGGTFSTVILPALSPGLEWLIDYNSQDITLRAAAIIVPVTWLDFTVSADKRNENHVDLAWSTAEEISNIGFEVERSTDGRSWEQLGFIEAEEKPMERYDYTYIDLNPNNGINYYRLKQLDYDGQYDYSTIRSIKRNSGEAKNFTVYPNPSSGDHIQISLEDTEVESLLTIWDLSGRLLHQEVLLPSKGAILVKGTSSLSPGTYIISINRENSSSRQKWVKL